MSVLARNRGGCDHEEEPGVQVHKGQFSRRMHLERQRGAKFSLLPGEEGIVLQRRTLDGHALDLEVVIRSLHVGTELLGQQRNRVLLPAAVMAASCTAAAAIGLVPVHSGDESPRSKQGRSASASSAGCALPWPLTSPAG